MERESRIENGYLKIKRIKGRNEDKFELMFIKYQLLFHFHKRMKVVIRK